MSNKQNNNNGRGRVAQGDDAGGDLGGHDRRGGKCTIGIVFASVCVFADRQLNQLSGRRICRWYEIWQDEKK